MGGCKHCKLDTRLIRGYCQTCNRYLRNGGHFHTPPPPGVVERDDRGFCICHICGMAFSKLGEHIKRKHKITTEEYKEKFGLCKITRLTSDEYNLKMRNHNLNNKTYKNLLRTKTRFKKGINTRVGQERRLQEWYQLYAKLDKMNKVKKNNKE